ncbi:MAG: OmpA family protein [Chitinophagales bacterium]|nr:OmpA family protein [Chitinophagales bacterium]
MKNILFISHFLLLAFLSTNINAQQVFWAKNVLKFSSQYGTKEFSAQQVLGVPNALPNYGKSMVAWAPASGTQTASITVEFERATQVQQIAIGENLLSGAVEKIYLYDQSGKEYLVYHQANPKPIEPQVARIFNHFIPLTSYKAIRLRLDLNYTNFRNLPQIDCIGISPDKTKIVPKINTIAYNLSNPYPENLGAAVNSQYNDMLPIISPDGSALYFARKNAPENMGIEKKDDIYESRKQANGQWSKAINVGAPLNTDEHNFVCAISPDGNTMYLANKYDYRTESQGVAVSQRQKNGAWSKPKPLSIANMYNKSRFACYHVSIDEKAMVMAIERDDTYGDMDLYVSFRYADGNWSEPINMGPDLNTAGAEASVFIAADGKTLYFSSNGHAGYGDFDMFMSKRLDNTWKRWSEPVNLGQSINTIGMDIYYTIPASGDYAYYSSERIGGQGLSDIYRISLPKELRPDAVKIDQGLFASTIPDVPKLKPYQNTETSDIDKRIEELRKQLNQSPNTPSSNDKTLEENTIEKRETQLNEDLKKLEEQYYTLPADPKNNFPAYTPPTVTYDPSYDDKINDLKRQLERAKLNAPAVPSTIYSSNKTDNANSYQQKLDSLQNLNSTNTNLQKPSQKPSKSKEENKKLNPYEEKLQQLLAAQNQPVQTPQEPVRIHENKSPEPTQTITSDNTTIDNTPSIAQNQSPKQQKELSSYEKKLKELQEAQEPAKTNNVPQENDASNLLADTIPVLPSTSKLQNLPKSQENHPSDWNREIAKLEDSLKILEQQKLQIKVNNEAAKNNYDSLQIEQQKLMNEKEKMAIAISQMQAEKEQLSLEKEKLENERKKLEALKKQQYSDINSLKHELDSLQKIKGQEPPVYNNSLADELNGLKKEVGKKILLKNVYFVVNASFIQSKSYDDLNQLAAYLIKNKDINVEVGGHTNGLCDDNFCNELSGKRAKSVMDYLVTRGVPIERLTYKGYGKTQNISDNNTEQGRKLNQRVEITITKVFE